MEERVNQILNFWFGNVSAIEQPLPEKIQLWFKKSEDTDKAISNHFSELLGMAGRGELQEWEKAPDSALALILLTDQFSRNIFRNSSEAFSFDPIALQNTLQSIDQGFDSSFHPLKRAFFYLPLEHSENIEYQKLSLKKFTELAGISDNENEKILKSYQDFAVKHYEIIARFGRFPHRNQVLGRISTQEETEFLKTPGSSF